MDTKPAGPYYSAKTSDEAKEDGVWIRSFGSIAPKYYSEDQSEFYKIKEIWMEKKSMAREVDTELVGNDYVLTVLFQSITKSDLHEFRLLNPTNETTSLDEKREHPDGTLRIRFPMNHVYDTLWLEVIERNPMDHPGWLTEKVIDTLLFTTKDRI